MEKTREELLNEMYNNLKNTAKPEYMNEVAMPGVYQPMNPKDMRNTKQI